MGDLLTAFVTDAVTFCEIGFFIQFTVSLMQILGIYAHKLKAVAIGPAGSY